MDDRPGGEAGRAGLRIGIDVGGTNTDSVVVDGAGTVGATAKIPTTDDPADGIADALDRVAAGLQDRVGLVALGTTHALNAILQRRGLRRVAVLRIGAPGTLAVPPLTAWPADLVGEIGAGSLIARGGVEIDGRAHPMDEAEIRAFASTMSGDGAEAIAIVGMGSPIDASQEEHAASLVAEAAPDLDVTLGHEVGGLGVRERENAAVLNAALGPVMERVISGLERAVAPLSGASAFLTQNDGTLVVPALARRLPVRTIGAGPANSLRGAAALTGIRDALVADVGGTSTDVGAISNGFPRESSIGVVLGGVATNFRMPDLVSVAVGGGTIVNARGGALGVKSVGHRLTSEALVFGGSTPTLTDAGVAAGRAEIGDVSIVSSRTDLARALVEATARVADAVDRMRLSGDAVDLVLVGGGSVLLPDAFSGVRRTERPEHADVANAVGAALAPVAGEADLIADVGSDGRAKALASCERTARERAALAGADPARLDVVMLEETPLAYLDRPVSRLRVKVAGPALG